MKKTKQTKTEQPTLSGDNTQTETEQPKTEQPKVKISITKKMKPRDNVDNITQSNKVKKIRHIKNI